jgi:orotate phosphoribosyltransferase
MISVPDTTPLNPKDALVAHLMAHAVRTDGPFTLRSGEVSDWYIDARQTTFDGEGATLVGEAVLSVLDPDATAVGGMTMGADPIAAATAIAAASAGRPLRAFSIRKEAKDHGTGGRLVGPVREGDAAAVLEDTTTTGSAIVEAVHALVDAGVTIVQVVSLVDRSGGTVADRVNALGIDYIALLTPAALGVE